MPTLYDLKPRFQSLLRPLTGALAGAGVTANMVTVAAMLLSIAAGAAIAAWPGWRPVYLLLPALLLVRMALNAIDGMLAREHGQASTLGAYLNEIGDVVSDTALILPFALTGIFQPWGVVAFALSAMLTEFTGVLGQATGGARRYDGPFGKSDRALALAVVAALIAFGLSVPGWGVWLFPVLTVLSLMTAGNRVRAGLRNR